MCIQLQEMIQINNMLKMQKQTKYNFTPIHLALLDQFENLFSRQNLCSNNYLYKQMNQNFQVPLYIIVEQRRIAQISNNQQIIREALQMCALVQIIDNKTLRIHQYPTLKFSSKHRDIVNEFAKNLKQQNRKIHVFQRKQDNQIHFSLLQRKPVKQLEQLALNFDKNWQFKTADLHADLKTGIARIRKLKQLNKKNVRTQKYSFDKPPGIFIRRAVQSSDDQQEPKARKQQHRNNNKRQQQKQKQKKYRQKPIINEEEFPTLS